MGIDRSPDKGAATSSNSCCPICNAEVDVTACQHEFHRKCIEAHWKKSLQCPVCKAVCRPKGLKVTDDPERRTRSQSRNQPIPYNVGRQTTDDIATTSGSNPISSNESIISANAITLLAMERRLLESLSGKMAELIQNSVADVLTRTLATQNHSSGMSHPCLPPSEESLQDRIDPENTRIPVRDHTLSPRSQNSQGSNTTEGLVQGVRGGREERRWSRARFPVEQSTAHLETERGAKPPTRRGSERNGFLPESSRRRSWS
nr:uncharacterized protein LOC122321438 [Drosophila bipectinata]